MKKKVIFSILFGLIFSVSLISAMTIKYYYSPDCPHCKEVSPLIQELSERFPEHNWEIYNVKETPNPYQTGVPAIVIDEEMILTGSIEIPEKLPCEVQQMTTKLCQTYSADTCIGNGESWFK